MTNCNNVFYSYVSYRRNIKDMPFVSKLTDLELAIGVARSLSEIFGEELEFKNLKNIDLRSCLLLQEEEIITKELIENKDISAYAYNEDYSKKILVNEEDHIRLIAKQSGFNIEHCFNMANKMDDHVLEKLEMCFNNKLGYLTANPELFGTGMEVGCMMFLPALWQSKKIKKLQGELLNGEFEFLDLDGKIYSGISPFVKVKNIYTFGNKENEFAEKIYKIVSKILELEGLEESKIFNSSSSSLADNIFRAYGTLANCYKISFNEAEPLLGYILWGLNLNMLKYKKTFNIYSFILSIKDTHIAFEQNVKETEKLRAKLLNKQLIEFVQKGEIDV